MIALDDEASELKAKKKTLPLAAETSPMQKAQLSEINARLKVITARKSERFEEKGIKKSPQKPGVRGKVGQDYMDLAAGALADDPIDEEPEHNLYLDNETLTSRMPLAGPSTLSQDPQWEVPAEWATDPKYLFPNRTLAEWEQFLAPFKADSSPWIPPNM